MLRPGKRKLEEKKGRQELVRKDPLKSFRGEVCPADTCSGALRFGDRVGDSPPVAVGFAVEDNYRLAGGRPPG
jgi:hypothetical protein